VRADGEPELLQHQQSDLAKLTAAHHLQLVGNAAPTAIGGSLYFDWTAIRVHHSLPNRHGRWLELCIKMQP
jgi:hypothetical protein